MRKHLNKKIAPCIVALCLIGFFIMNTMTFMIFDISLAVKIIALIASIIISAVVIGVLIERIKEINGGEEDDLGKY